LEFLDGEGAVAMLIQLREKPHQALKNKRWFYASIIV